MRETEEHEPRWLRVLMLTELEVSKHLLTTQINVEAGLGSRNPDGEGTGSL